MKNKLILGKANTSSHIGGYRMAKVIVQYLMTVTIDETLDRVEGEFNPLISHIKGVVITNIEGDKMLGAVEEFSIVDAQEIEDDEEEDEKFFE